MRGGRAATEMGEQESNQGVISADKARELIASGEARALDVRSQEEWVRERITGAMHVPLEELDSRLEEIAGDQRLIVVASDEEQAREVMQKLRERDHDALTIEGGIESWADEGYTLQPSDDAEGPVTEDTRGSS